jgi:hypothetical protein
MPFRALLLAAVLGAVPAISSAQAVIRPERQPARVAGQEAWYRAGEPILFRGDLFYPAGAQVFFNATVMVLAGEYRGVPLYVDPTVETDSLVYLPIGNGLMQPYERPRAGDLAGTSGSRTPSFPPETPSSVAPAAVPIGTTGLMPPAPPVGDSALAAAAARTTPAPRTITIAPQGAARGRGIWIDWNGQSWRAAGGSVRIGPQFVAIGSLNGRTVYRGPDERTIWIETVQGLASPWRR